MKRILLILIVAVIGAAAATARDFEYTYEGQTLTYTVLDEDAKTCSVARNSGISGNLIIPESASDGSNEYSVTSIGINAFNGCSGLTSVSIPETVTSIGSGAFLRCSITSITLHESLTSIGEMAFARTALTSVTIPNSVTTIPYEAFYNCSGLTSVTIPSSVTVISNEAFGGCVKLKSLDIPNSVTTIGGSAFYECSSLTSVTIPSSVTSIGPGPFGKCVNLVSINVETGNTVYSSSDGILFNKNQTELLQYPGSKKGSYNIPNTVTTIGGSAFSGCSGLTSVAIPNSVTSIGGWAFYDCSGLTSVTIPNSVTTIGGGAFSGCSGLTSVAIPNSVTSIGGWAFQLCSGLTSVTIGSSVISIGGSAFNYCDGLTLVKVLATEPPEYSGFSGDVLANAVLDVPAGSLKKYAVSAWGAFNNIREDGVMSKTYNDGVFKYRLLPDAVNPEAVLIKGDYSAKEEVSIPERFTDESDPTNPVRYTISTIGPNAFSGCGGLKEVNFHSRSKITTIAANAFYSCRGLTEVRIPDNVTTIGSSAFEFCSGLTEVSIPETVTTIGSSAFSSCSGLTKAQFASIESLCNINFANYGANPLYYAHHLYINGEEITDVVIPESVTSIGNYAFYECNSLTSVTIPNSVTTIGGSAFGNCTGLTSVAIPNSVTSIGGSAFYSCTGLTSASIGNSLSELDSSVFSGCDAISSLTLADGGNYLELQGEASWLDKVTNLYLGRNMMTPEGAFVKFPALTDLEIGEGITEITPSAFSGYSGLASLKLSNAVAKIGSNAFAGCSSLTSVAIPNSVNSLGNRAFSGCSALTDLTIGNSVPSVSSTVFEGCPAIKTLTVADGPGTLSFQSGNSWLTNVTKLYMGRNMAYSTGGDLKFPAVSDLTVGNEVTEIGSSMFANCSGITEVALGNSLQTIGSSAFSGCSLTEVVVPPSVETIEASAFAGNNDLATIIMGHNVKTIGEKAYDGCAAQTIRITALTPPTAPNNTFSRYTGQLWVANAQAVEAYYDAYTCWDRFSAYSMIEPEAITIEGEKTIDAAPGTVIRLTATITPENVTLPHIFWRSTDPAIATVDNDGVVTVHGEQPEYAAYATYAYGDEQTPGQCRIIAESLYADGPLAEVVINSDFSAIDDITVDLPTEKATVDYSQPYDVYNMQGIRIGDSTTGLLPGLYIIRQGAATAKIAIR